jgi:ribose 5-phosphate isomerase B
MMRVAIGSDHRGFGIKKKVAALLEQLGHDVLDVGTDGTQSVDYPDFANAVSRKVTAHAAERGILICGTGIGMAIAANKVQGIRAATCHDELTAQMSRLHNDTNILCLAADLLGEPLIDRMVETWLNTSFEEGRHLRRVEKIGRIEAEDPDSL